MGLGNVFRSFARWVLPVIKAHALPIIKTGAQTIGTEAIKTATNLANDTISGVNIQDSLKDRTKEAINELSAKAQKAIQHGSGYKRVRFDNNNFSSQKTKIKKRRLEDIFD